MLLIVWVCVGLAAGAGGDAAPSGGDPPPPHCFRKIASGERLVAYDVTRIIDRSSAGECEGECNVYRCTFFSFGNATAGNGSCELTTDRQISRRQDPAFELYERTSECAEGKPTGYEKACYRRIIAGKRLHERFIRHSLPCNSLQACQHQCSIERHFSCEGFNIRLDPAGVGRGICELSSVDAAHLDPSRDFVFDPEFAYYERDRHNGLPNCGPPAHPPHPPPPPPTTPLPDPPHNPAPHPPGGPYYGGDSYGPWTSGHATADHGPWGSHGYGSGLYQPTNPSRGPPPPFHQGPHHPHDYAHGYGHRYGYDYAHGYHHGYHHSQTNSFHPAPGPPTPPAPSYLPPSPYPQSPFAPSFRPAFRPRYHGYGDASPPPARHPLTPSSPPGYRPRDPAHHSPTPFWAPPSNYPPGDRRHDRPNRVPTYIIIDADAGHPYGPRGPQPPPSHAPFGISSNAIGHEVCFRREHSGYKLSHNTIRGMYDTPTVLDCEAMCTSSPFKCTGYSYRYATAGSGPNCLLTDHSALDPHTHLLPDRSCDVYFRMATCMDFDRAADTECFLKVATARKLDPAKLAKAIAVDSMSDCELACLSSPFFTCRSFSFRHGPPVIGEPVENCFLSDWPMSALTHPDLLPAPGHEVYERGSFGHGCELDAGPPHIGPRPPFAPYPNIPQPPFPKDPWGLQETWRHFTVSGWPCRSGTECELNPVGGFWACEVEGGDQAQWDYCCRPKHSCGFSRGYHYPWCYVGEAGPEQWRPCSEFYYPEFGNRYQYKPVHPVDSHSPPRDTRPWTFGAEDFGPPSAWPISYVYAEPPPNETYVWDPEDLHFYHDPPEPLHDDSPRIRFKPCGQRHPYPRAIVQKLDLKNIPKAPDPEDQSRKDNPTTPAPAPAPEPHPPLHPTPHPRQTSPTAPPPPSTPHPPEEPPPDAPPTKAKQLIHAVDKIIMETSSPPQPDNETLKHGETSHPPFFSLTLLEQPYVWQ